jgi:hypothetical protein
MKTISENMVSVIRKYKKFICVKENHQKVKENHQKQKHINILIAKKVITKLKNYRTKSPTPKKMEKSLVFFQPKSHGITMQQDIIKD